MKDVAVKERSFEEQESVGEEEAISQPVSILVNETRVKEQTIRTVTNATEVDRTTVDSRYNVTHRDRSKVTLYRSDTIFIDFRPGPSPR